MYRIGREEIADSLTQVIALDGGVAEEALVLDVLPRFGDRSVDFADAMWAAMANQPNLAVAAFDRDYRGLDEAVEMPE